jgi:hypothetical protein
VLAVHEK